MTQSDALILGVEMALFFLALCLITAIVERFDR